MSVRIVSHRPLIEQGVEEVIIEDSHGRQMHIHAPIFHGPHPDEFIAQQIAEFEAQEAKLSEHLAERFEKQGTVFTRKQVK